MTQRDGQNRTRLKKRPAIVEKPVRTVKISDRNPVRDNAAEVIAGGPDVQMERRRFNCEGRRQARIEIKCDGMIGRRTNRGCRARESRQHGAMHVAGGNEPRAAMTAQNLGKVARIAQVLHIHMGDTGFKRRMMQEKKRRPCH